MTRIRKNWTSSRGNEDSCTSQVRKARPSSWSLAEREVAHTGKADASTRDPPQLPIEMQAGAGLEPAGGNDAALAAVILKSLENEPSYKIRDCVLPRGAFGKQGRSDDEHCFRYIGDGRCGSDSDFGLSGTSSVERGAEPKSSSVSCNKMDSDMTSGAMERERGMLTVESAEESLRLVSGKNDAPAMKAAMVGRIPALHENIVAETRTGVKKKRTRHCESDVDLALTTVSQLWNPSAEEGGSERIRVTAKPEKGAVAPKGEKIEASSFPAGWAYRGLAQIAEQDRAAQGKQCARTDGRFWRCPLKVYEGSTLCEHHLNKFRLKKLGKLNQRKMLLDQQQKMKSDQQQTGRPETRPHLKAQSIDTSDISAENDAPAKFRRRHKTVKLSVL